jgi:uncharacterized membrane protein affecting hemolysin expression
MTFEPQQVMQVLVWMAGLIVALLMAIIGFVVGWQLRQDRKLDELLSKTATDGAALEALRETVKHNIPELFKKWDEVILERKGKP